MSSPRALADPPLMRDHLQVASRLLLVEDDERIRASMRLALEDEGYEIDEAATGEEGLEIFAQRPADVALIDLMLPGTPADQRRSGDRGHRPLRHSRCRGWPGGRRR